MGALLVEPGGVKEGSGDRHLFPCGPHWETWERVHMLGAYVWMKVLEWVCLHIGGHTGEPGEEGSVYR
jgi:hypothetical protein